MGTFRSWGRFLSGVAGGAGIAAALVPPHDPLWVTMGLATWALGGLLYVLVA